MALITQHHRKRWTRQPQHGAQVERNARARDLCFMFVAGLRNRELTRGLLGSMATGDSYTPTAQGMAFRGGRVANGGIDFGAIQPITGDAFTVLVAANPSSAAACYTLFSQRNGSAPYNQIDLAVNSDTSLGAVPGRLSAITLDTSTAGNAVTSNLTVYADGGWHVYGMTRSGAGATPQLYFDGGLQGGTAIGASTGTSISGAMRTRVGNIGDYGADGAYAAQCDILYAIAWNRVLDPVELRLYGSVMRPEHLSLLRGRKARRYISLGAASAASVTTSLNAAIQLSQTAAASINVGLQSSRTSSSVVDAAVRDARAAQASLDGALRALGQAVASVDVAVRATGAATAPVDAAVQLARNATAALDLAVAAQRSATAAMSTQVQAGALAAASLDAYVQAGASVGTSASAAVLASALAQASVDIAVMAPRSATGSVSAALNAARQAAGVIDAALQLVRNASSSMSAQVQAGTSAAVSIDVAVRDARAATSAVEVAIATAASAATSLGAVVSLQRSISAAMTSAVLSGTLATLAVGAYVSDPNAGFERLADISTSRALSNLRLVASRPPQLSTTRRRAQ